MKKPFRATLLLLPVLALPCAAQQVEVSIRPVALSGRPAPGLATNLTFGNIYDFSIANDGRVAFTADFTGPGVTSTNDQGVWANLSSGFQLLARTGDPVPGTNGFGYFTPYFLDPNMIDGQTAFFGFTTTEEPAVSPNKPTVFAYGKAIYKGLRTLRYQSLSDTWLAFFAQNPRDDPAGLVELSGPGIGPTNNMAIVAGPPTNLVILAQTASPAPGNAGTFTSFDADERRMVLTPDGRVAFHGSTSTTDGLWFGDASGLQGVALSGSLTPASWLGPGHTFSFLGDTLEVNGSGELAFDANLKGPTINATNYDFVVAGAPGALRIVAQSGQPAPGIPGAFFQFFTYELIGEDGAVAFAAAYGTNGFGLWLAPANGAIPILLMHTGLQAPGAPAGVYFTNTFFTVPPFQEVFMNGRNEVVLHSYMDGPGSDTNLFRNTGIWLAEPDGRVIPVARTGQMMDIGGGALRELQNVTFGDNPPSLGGPADGRARLINNAGQILFWSTWLNPPGPPDFGSEGQGLFVAQAGLILSATRSGNDIVLSFPTLAGRHYRVDSSSNLSAAAWSALVPSVTGNGGQLSVTNHLLSTAAAFYRAVRTD